MEESAVKKFGWDKYIGQDMGSRTGETVTAKDIRHFALAIDDPNPIYYDEEAAKKGKYGGMVAPPEYIFWATSNASIEKRVKDLTETGFAQGAFLGIPELPGIWTLGWVRGSDDYEFLKPVRIGDRITVNWKITDIKEREARSGRLVFITSEHEYTNQKGEALAHHRITMIGMPVKE